jgi:hypothetical protein
MILPFASAPASRSWCMPGESRRPPHPSHPPTLCLVFWETRGRIAAPGRPAAQARVARGWAGHPVVRQERRVGGTKKLCKLDGASCRRCRGRRQSASERQRGEVGSRDLWRLPASGKTRVCYSASSVAHSLCDGIAMRPNCDLHQALMLCDPVFVVRYWGKLRETKE